MSEHNRDAGDTGRAQAASEPDRPLPGPGDDDPQRRTAAADYSGDAGPKPSDAPGSAPPPPAEPPPGAREQTCPDESGQHTPDAPEGGDRSADEPPNREPGRESDGEGDFNASGQELVDRDKIDFDPDDGLYSGTAIDGSSDIPGPHEQGDDVGGSVSGSDQGAETGEADGPGGDESGGDESGGDESGGDADGGTSD